MATFPRYNEIQQRSIHNAYAKQEQLLDQLLHYRVRTVEFDLHKYFYVGCPYMPPPDWGVFHLVPAGSDERGNVYNLCRLGEVLQLLRVFHDADPKHEVVTVHLELKSRSAEGPGVKTFGRYTPDQLDAKLTRTLGRRTIFTPADLLSANPGAPSLLDAVNRAGTGSGGWPTIDKLRGKFIFVVHTAGDSEEIDEYATAANANGRVGFIMRETLWRSDPTVRRNSHVVFHGEVENDRAIDLRDHFPGLILRSRSANDPDSFFNAQGSSCNLILTDRVDIYDAPWARTHNEHQFPFARAGLRGEEARSDPSVRDLHQRQQFYVLCTHSDDIWGTADSFSFAHTRSFPSHVTASGTVEDDWSAMMASTSNDRVDGWGKCLLMARDGLHAGARYFAVGRAADDHGLRIQWREHDGGETGHAELGDYTYQINGHDTYLGHENIHWVRLLVQEMPFTAKRFVGFGSIDGRNWRKIGERVLNGDFQFRGLAASGKFSRHGDFPGVEYHIHRLRRNGQLPTGFETVEVGTADLSKLTLFGEPTRRRSVLLMMVNRVDNEVVLRSEQRRGETTLCDANLQFFIWSDVQTASVVTYLAEPRDYESPRLEWSVGGVTLTGTGRGQASVNVDGRPVQIGYSFDQPARTLILSSRPEDGAYSVEVQVRATEQNGRSAIRSNRVPFSVVGRRTGFGSDYHNFVSGCLRESLLKLRVPPDIILRLRRTEADDRRFFLINEARLSQLVRELASSQPDVANQLRELAREVMSFHR